ncbi:uncharacterized protein LOC133521008 [Cydia pomonella]|uniref:uncharacterized protein LOC133521008 n=1 Tax=Cydia pomonella TaxID=82600 RepID=UPI002ADD486E|nr:uncharacterized protein LOC133521008 [Cydia pomonella]
MLRGSPLQTVTRFKYVGHWVTDTLKDDVYIVRERRTLSYNNVFRGLLGLPWHCSASGIFATWRTDCFEAVLRKRVASLGERVRTVSNTLLKVIVEKMDSPILTHGMYLHVQSNCYYTFY